MAHWARAILSPNSRKDESGQAAAGRNPSSPGRMRPPARLTEAEILENAYGIPTLPSSSISSHSRSMSHPFPSLFIGKKHNGGKKNKDTGADSGDEATISPALARQTAQNAIAKTPKAQDKDLTTGKCMTCDSLVRWPKDLNVFRCTVCLTINDLKPVVLEARRGDGSRASLNMKTGAHVGGAPITHRVPSLSIDKTKQLLDHCITSYLLKRLKHDDSDTSPPQSPASRSGDTPRNEVPEEVESEDQKASEDTFQPTSPIHLTEFPLDGQYRTLRMVPSECNRSRSIPYSTSSPGTFFGSHMEQRERKLRHTPAESPGGRGTFQGGYFDAKNATNVEEESRGQQKRVEAAKSLFKPLEDYIVMSFASFESVNSSFSTLPGLNSRVASEGIRRAPAQMTAERRARADESLSELDAKTLLLGDFAENGFWWTGERSSVRSPDRMREYHASNSAFDSSITIRTPRINWVELNEWYHLAINPGKSWQQKLDKLTESELSLSGFQHPCEQEMEDIEEQILVAQAHTQRVLLKATETLLKRPGRPLREPDDLRFLLIILANPLLYPSYVFSGTKEQPRSRSKPREALSTPHSGPLNVPKSRQQSPSHGSKGSSGQHSGIIKRLLGLLSNVPNECHHHLVSWFARYSDAQFQKITDLIGSFVTYRLTRQHGKKQMVLQDPTAGLIPNISGGRTTSAALHAALGASGQPPKKSNGKRQPVVYSEDWQIKAAARVMALLFSANNSGVSRRLEARPLASLETEHSAGLVARERAHVHGQILPTSDFYNTLLDYSDLVADFEAWEARRGKFAFCQYPFFLSIWAKIQIMEHDARRQMEVKAREAWFDSIMTNKSVNQYLVLKIRRECLVEDSLKGVSEVVGSGGEEIKKGLRIEFKGEEGIDAGGLRKEWFLLLVRDVFNPEHGMFIYDEDSGFCYFNPNGFETTDQFFLVGIVLGLAIYNSTILDIALPPFAFRKLLAAGPVTAPGATSHAKPSMTYSLEDLAEYRPSLAFGLKQLLDFEGNVESTFCRDFVADVDRYGQVTQVPLCPDGEKKAVTNANRREFVDLYVRYMLDTAVARQFEPFKRGFFTVCGGNALSLFRPEEIELLIRGSDEPLDIASLQAVSVYEHWGVAKGLAENEAVVQWFWETFQNANAKDQRKLLSFITGSDRIPAMGATNLVIKLTCLGPDSPRFPVARTCFNMLSLYRYSSKEKLESMLWTAVNESEGFGLK